MPPAKNRYPGIRSFEADDQILFYGRSREIDELFNLIKIKPLVALFGKSGLGKTSLLKAGVGPLLLKQHYYPIMIRLQDTDVPPTVSVLNALEKYIDKDLLNKYGNKTKNKIWENLNAASFQTARGLAATPVLIFDQFEELFNHPKKVQEAFASHIGDLIENRLPSDIEDALNQVPRSQRTNELMSWFRPPNVKIIFAIRSDRMSELHKMRFEIPAILQNRYELKPLHAQQAKDAIERPAALSGSEFNTQPFTFAPETIEKIQSELSNEFEEIESFQLQIICQYIERNVKKEQADGKQNIVVEPSHLGGKEGIQGILKNYYNNQIALLGTNEEQLAARQLLEEGLIVNKRRIGVAEAMVKESYKISDNLLEKLLTSRLIRPEDTRLGRTYEISHDTLVKPILGALKRRKAGEQRMEEIRERLDIQKRRKRARIAAVVNLLIALGCGIGLIFVYGWYKDARQLRKEAEEAKAQLAEFMKAKTDAAIAQLDSTIVQLEKDSVAIPKEVLKIQRAKLQKTKIELDDAYEISKTEEGRQQLERFNLEHRREEKAYMERYRKLISELFSTDERRRVRARDIVLKKYGDNPEVLHVIIDASKGKINKKYQNSIYQIIYILEKSETKALSPNRSEIKSFINEVRKTGLAGERTEKSLIMIERKLK
jgi:Novel STAND NTPase 1